MNNLLETAKRLFPQCNITTLTVIQVNGRVALKPHGVALNVLDYGSAYLTHARLTPMSSEMGEAEIDGKAHVFVYYPQGNLLLTTAPCGEAGNG